MTAGEQAVVDARALEDLERVARHLRAIDAARPVRRRPSRRPAATPAGVDGHDGQVWWAAAPDVAAVALALEARARRPAAAGRWAGSPERPLPSPPATGRSASPSSTPTSASSGWPAWWSPPVTRGGAATTCGSCRAAWPPAWPRPPHRPHHGHRPPGRRRPGGVPLPAGPPPVPAGPAVYELLALARWMGIEATGPALVEAALRWLGAAPTSPAAPAAPVDATARRPPRPGRPRVRRPRRRPRRPRRRPDPGAGAGRPRPRPVPGLAAGPAPLARLDRTLTALWAEGVARAARRAAPTAADRPGPAPSGPWPGV